MLLDGCNHVAVLTADTDRFVAFYREVFEATVDGEVRPGDGRRRRLMTRGASDGFATDLGPVLSLFLRDPDGLEGEVCIGNPDARLGVVNPPRTPAARDSEG